MLSPTPEMEKFWGERLLKYGKDLRFFSFARLLKKEIPEEQTGLLYVIDEVLYFENFPQQSSGLLTFFDRSGGPTFASSLSFSTPLASITKAVKVRERRAYQFLRGRLSSEELDKEAAQLERLPLLFCLFASVLWIHAESPQEENLFLFVAKEREFRETILRWCGLPLKK